VREPEEDTRWANHHWGGRGAGGSRMMSAKALGVKNPAFSQHPNKRKSVFKFGWEKRFVFGWEKGFVFRRDLCLDGRRDLTCRVCGMEMEKDEGAACEQAALQGKDGRMGFWFGWEKGSVKFVMSLTSQIVF
jgi:hypothetical protein